MRALLVMACALGVASAGCKRTRDRAHATPTDDAAPAAPVDPRPTRIVITGVSVVTIDPKQPVELSRAALGDAMMARLIAGGPFARRAGEVPAGYRPRDASLEVAITYDVADETVSVDIESVLVWDDAGDELVPWADVSAEHRVDPAGGGAAVRAVIAATVDAAGDALIRREAIRTGPVDAVREGVASDDPALARWSLDVVRERRLAGAFDAVAAVLGADDRELRGAAVAALVAIGDPRAVDLMAHSVEFSDHAMLEQIIDASAELGGDDARAFLDFVATGHPDLMIRDRAAGALERVGE